MSKEKIKLVTHSGRFHADEVFASAILIMLFEKTDQDYELIRSRDKKDIEKGDIVYDNGLVYDPEKKIFDHHQEDGAGVRENNVPYAAFGLIWKHYGQDLIEKYFQEENLNIENIKEIHKLIDENIVQPTDAADTGYEDYRTDKKDLRAYMFDDFVRAFNPTNKEGYDKSYDLFMQAVEIAKKVLERELIQARSKNINLEKIKEIYNETDDKRIIVLEEGGAWKEFLISKEEPLFVIFPTVDNDGYMIQAVNKEKTGYDVRKAFPENWRGKTNAELEKETGVIGSKFCHLAGFLCVTKTKEQAVEIAKIAVDKK